MVFADTDEIRRTATQTNAIADEVNQSLQNLRKYVAEGSADDLLGYQPALKDQPGVLLSIASTLELVATDADLADSVPYTLDGRISLAIDGLQAWVDGNVDPATEAEWQTRVRGLLEQGKPPDDDEIVASTLESLPPWLVQTYWSVLTPDERAQLIESDIDVFERRVEPLLPTASELFAGTVGVQDGDSFNPGHLDYDGNNYDWFIKQQSANEYGDGSYWSVKPWAGSPTYPYSVGGVSGGGELPDGADGMIYVVVRRDSDPRRDKLELDGFTKWSLSEMVSGACGSIPLVGGITGPACGAAADEAVSEAEHDNQIYPVTVIAAPVDHSGEIVGEPEVISVEITLPNDAETIAAARAKEDGTSGTATVAPVVGDIFFDMEPIDKIRPT